MRALNCKYSIVIDSTGPTPPPANYIMEALQKALNDRGVQLDVITRSPDIKWALGILSTLVSQNSVLLGLSQSDFICFASQMIFNGSIL